MSARIQVVVDEAEREAFRQRALRSGMSLSAWLRDAGRRRLQEDTSNKITTVEELRAFFALRPDEGAGPEPDWDEHLAAIDQSRRTGLPDL